MTKEYFYTCPIKALYMMKEFGVKFIVGDQGYYGYNDCLPYTLEHLSNHHTKGKFRVAKKSEHIFINDYDDIGIDKGGDCYDYYISDYWKPMNKDLIPAPNESIKIIVRNNKQFFTPEVEMIKEF